MAKSRAGAAVIGISGYDTDMKTHAPLDAMRLTERARRAPKRRRD